LTTANTVRLAKKLMKWFEEQGCQPSDAMEVMAIVIAAMAKGPNEKRVLAAITRAIAETVEEPEF